MGEQEQEKPFKSISEGMCGWRGGGAGEKAGKCLGKHGETQHWVIK